ncbi:hypothetical protein HII12_004787 [Brettanomyces bruxellensis]|uniref:Phosphatidylinositol N-acetylglucosaminyltransferase subunit H conserved domain-containing protein n=1 Tax=Dekkera bruxellensis TaxID=5007 RepID=A0A8H6EQL2_DEKBR|nr:hypothetical protein HII12_004787 [Brettanomyces bruxellensis]
MQKDYILEIESSETECPKLVYQQSQQPRRWSGKGQKNEKNEGAEKFVRFTVRKSRPISILTFGTASRLITGFLLTILLFHTLSEVDPIRNVIRLLYGLFWNDPNGGVNAKISFMCSVVRSLKRIGVAKYGKEHSGWPSILDIVYFVGSAKFTDWLFWQIDGDIEESLLIIPNLGVQCESVILKRSLAGLGMIVERAVTAIGLLQGKIQSHVLRKEETGRQRELSISRKQLDRLITLDKSLSKCSRLVLSREFVPMEYVKDLVINEGFVKFQVLFYLSLITKNGSDRNNQQQSGTLGIQPAGKGETLKMIVVFPHLLPRRKLLETVWRRSRKFIER